MLHHGVSLKDGGLAVKFSRSHFSVLALASKVLVHIEYVRDFRVNKMLEGWDHKASPSMAMRQPCIPVLLKRLRDQWGTICPSSYELELFHSTSLVAFF